MIVNTSIKSGFVNMVKEGAYFSLISASGIVNVELRQKGSTVIDSKMWVGMSLPQAMPYDEIIITSDKDQPIEIWAGKVAMSNNGSLSLKGANAIRCSKVAVMGEVLITGADLTRTAVRVRTDKEVVLGGAGVGVGGWRLPAGSYEEIPIAGSLFAYKAKPVIKIEDSVYQESITDGFPKTFRKGAENIFVSSDEAVRLSWEMTGKPMLWTQAGGWISHPSFTGLVTKSFGMIEDDVSKKIYAINFNGSNGTYSYSLCHFYIYESVDGGLTFNQIATINVNDQVSQTLMNNSTTTMSLTLLGSVLSMNLSGSAVGYNIFTKEWRAVGAGEVPASSVNMSGFSNVWFTSDDLSELSFLSNQDYKIRSLNGLGWSNPSNESWTDIFIADAVNWVGFSTTGTRQIHITNDAGVSWHYISRSASNGNEDGITHAFDGLFLMFTSGILYSYQVVDDELISGQALDTHAGGTRYMPYVLPTGRVYIFDDTETVSGRLDVDIWQLSIEGDLTPALVEVMELLN